MRYLLPVAALLLAAAPAFADDDAAFKATIEANTKIWAQAFNNHDAAPIAAFYAPDGVFVQADGQVERAKDRPESIKKYFAAGLTEEIDVSEAHRFGNAAYAIGSFRFLNANKEVVLRANWTAAYRMDGDKPLIELLTASVPPPPPKT